MKKVKDVSSANPEPQTFSKDLNSLREWLFFRINHLKTKEVPLSEEKPSLLFPPFLYQSSPYDEFMLRFHPNDAERLVLLLALIPHVQPDFFESIILQVFPEGADLPEIGGAKGKFHRGMMPTGETAAFLLSGTAIERRRLLLNIFSGNHFYFEAGILNLETVDTGEPRLSGRILLSEEYSHYFITGNFAKPGFGQDFPAKWITTGMAWEDLVLHSSTAGQIEAIELWMKYHAVLDADTNLSKKMMKGYRALFHGRPGTGKTLTATLLGKEFNKEVYRIDLSQVVSKYIGETEKNLNKVFDRAQNKDWILFFDEADALFGKRTNVQNAHDKYANQETAFLLQRIEDFSGLIILASNFKSNIDEAFLRRFHAVVHFPMPNAQERFKLWERVLPDTIPFEKLPLEQLSAEHEINGAAIVNVMQFACLKALAAPQKRLTLDHLLEGIRREKQKQEG